MKVEIKVPAMGESISEATIGTVLKETGTLVKADEEILELETDKVNQVIYAPKSGFITWSIAKEEVVKIGQVLGYIDTDQSDVSQPSQEIKKPENTTEPQTVEEKDKNSQKVQEIEKEEFSPSIPEKLQPQASDTLGARISKDLFLAELSQKSSPENMLRPKIATSEQKHDVRKKMSKIRKIIAKRLVDVLQQTAMLTTFNEVDMTAIVNLREKYRDAFLKKYQVKLGFMPFFVKAVVAALREFPDINAYIDGEDIVYLQSYDIGIAVGTDKGVIVPVIKNCETLSFGEIEKNLEDYAKQSREGRISPDALQGGGFTITNGGTYGSLLSTPILNPPQSAILGMHKIMKRPVVVDEDIVIRHMMYLALSYDHRIVDGMQAVSFLVAIKNALEDPARMLLDL